MECGCKTCQTACSHRPGWFAPGQIAKAAALLGMTEKEFFNTYIGVDWWEQQEPTYVLAPVTDAATPGSEYPFDPHGTCVFYKEGKCSIHAAKPHECAFYDHSKSDAICMEERQKLVKLWEDNQAEIERLLGRPPDRPSPDIFEVFGLLTRGLR